MCVKFLMLKKFQVESQDSKKKRGSLNVPKNNGT